LYVQDIFVINQLGAKLVFNTFMTACAECQWQFCLHALCANCSFVCMLSA